MLWTGQKTVYNIDGDGRIRTRQTQGDLGLYLDGNGRFDIWKGSGANGLHHERFDEKTGTFRTDTLADLNYELNRFFKGK